MGRSSHIMVPAIQYVISIQSFAHQHSLTMAIFFATGEPLWPVKAIP